MPARVELPPSPRLKNWARRLQARHGHEVSLVLTENRTSMVSIRPRGRRASDLRLHRAFDHAPLSVLRDLESVLVNKDREAWRRVGRFARSIPAQEPAYRRTRRERAISLNPRGDVFDLESLLAEVKAKWFDPDLVARITWGRAPRRRGRRHRRSIVFASWHEDQRLIRVHPSLDQRWVPREFMRYLIYHELCHAMAKPQNGTNGRRKIHHAEFKELERQYPRFSEMERISQDIFKRLARE